MMQPFTRALVLAALVLLGACAQNQPLRLYEGEPRGESDIAVVQVPMELEVMRVNGRRIEGLNTLFSPEKRDLHLEPGQYRILAYYKDLWELSGDTHDIIKTDPALFVLDAEAGHRYRLGFDEPEDIEQARALEQEFSGYVLDTHTGEKTPTRASGLAFQDGILGSLGEMAGMQPTESSTDTASAGPSKTVKPLSTASASASDTKASASDRDRAESGGADPGVTAGTSADTAERTEAVPRSDGDYLDLLKAYWSQATKEERRAFLKWISTEEERGKKKAESEAQEGG